MLSCDRGYDERDGSGLLDCILSPLASLGHISYMWHTEHMEYRTLAVSVFFVGFAGVEWDGGRGLALHWGVGCTSGWVSGWGIVHEMGWG